MPHLVIRVIVCSLLAWGNLAKAVDAPPASQPGAAVPHSPAPARVAVADDALGAYVSRPDPTYAWKEQGRTTLLNITGVELTLTSQTWRDTAWKHRVLVLMPQKIANPRHALLLINGGSWRGDPKPGDPPRQIKLSPEAMALAAAVEQLSCPIVVVSQVPFQPMFDGRREDALIAYTFDQFLNSEDATWPLLLPMVKSAVRAMDAASEFLKIERGLSVDQFTVTGASKRGWTTWLTAAADPRVVAAAPMVIDMLNMGAQAKHQIDVWGEYSSQIKDYVNLDIPSRLSTDRGVALRRIVDPYSYREKLAQPKLLIFGSNDPYWPVDSSNFYFDDLVGEKFRVIVPNAGHDLGRDFPRVVGTLAAFQQHVYGTTPLPKLKWQFERSRDGSQHVLSVESDRTPQAARAWVATATSSDFRRSSWKASAMRPTDGGGFEYLVDDAAGKHVAVFGELVFEGRMPFYLSSNVNIVAGKAPPTTKP